MADKRKFKSKVCEAIHSCASALHEIDAIDAVSMRRFDESCLAKPRGIRAPINAALQDKVIRHP